MAQQQQQTQQRPKIHVLNLDEVNHALVPAQAKFDDVVRQEDLVLNWNSELDFATRRIMSDPSGSLRKADPQTLTACMLNLAHVGLTLNPLKQHCTLVARWVKEEQRYEAAVLPMYRGLVWLATQAGVHDVVVDVVYEADVFDMERSESGDRYKHIVNIRTERGTEGNQFLGVFVAARMPKSNLPKVEWIPRKDIFAMRDKSDSYLDGEGKIRPYSPWVIWFEEMAKKGGLKRAQKRWEEAMDHGKRWDRFQRAVDLSNKLEGVVVEGQSQGKPEDPKLTLEQITAIEKAASELRVRDVEAYLGKVCAAYGVDALSEVSQSKEKEILERIAEAKKQSEKRAAKKKGAKGE